VTYQIVGEDEADLKLGLINISSPIARALIGKEEGDTAEVQAPGGIRRYEVVACQLPVTPCAMKSRLALVTFATLWWGSLTTIGFWVVPMLFAHLPAPAMAGGMAARLFAAPRPGSRWMRLAAVAADFKAKRRCNPVSMGASSYGFSIVGDAAALLVQFGVAPRIVARQDLRLWHRWVA
jgi:hypothetical protein